MRAFQLFGFGVARSLLLLAVVAASVGSATAETTVCGDHDGSGSLVASDALVLLKKAVGQNVEVQCPGCTGGECSQLGEFCVTSEDCCEVIPPPSPPGGSAVEPRGIAAATCCGGTCASFAICGPTGVACDCGAECCSGSCGQTVPGQCDD